ncbi:prepilin-type N-terminal cleavage/methylation domain-containing protein, partial [Pseudoalteromonas tunicata]
MKKQQGFTLIELIIVIVILGILAVTAAPKFLN